MEHFEVEPSKETISLLLEVKHLVDKAREKWKELSPTEDSWFPFVGENLKEVSHHLEWQIDKSKSE